MMKIQKIFLSAIMTITFCSCNDGRPEDKEAISIMQKQYPGVKVLDAQLSMDEVVARSFIVTYATSNGVEHKKEIQFMADKAGNWEPMPQLELNYK